MKDRMLINGSYWVERDLKRKKKKRTQEFMNIRLNEISQIQESVPCDDICMKF